MHRVLVIVGVPLWEDCHADCGWKQAVMAMGTGGVLRGSGVAWERRERREQRRACSRQSRLH